MTGRYDDLSSETTRTSDNDCMPQDYLDDVRAQIEAIQPAKRRREPSAYEQLCERKRRETEEFIKKFFAECMKLKLTTRITDALSNGGKKIRRRT